jgi:hypothetical protein
MRVTIAGTGVGSTYEWTGNNKVGQGRMTLLELTPGQRVRIKLEFIKPFTATNNTVFTLTPKGPQTDVLWEMTGTNNFMAKVFDALMNMDKMVGRDFEKGLLQMKSAAEV